LSGNLAIDGEEVDLEDGGDGFFGDPALSGFLGHFEAQHGPWSFVLAPIFVQADMHGEQAPATDADLTIHAQVHEAFVAREIVPGFEWMLGARYQELETDMDLSVAGQPVGSHDSTRSWVDPIVGMRYHSTLGGNWSLNARGDIGGFGVGSDLAWNASVMVGYQVSSLVRLHLGYRALNVDFEDGGDSQRLAYDLSMYGPILGVAFSF
jgi:hypothetical protein